MGWSFRMGKKLNLHDTDKKRRRIKNNSMVRNRTVFEKRAAKQSRQKNMSSATNRVNSQIKLGQHHTVIHGSGELWYDCAAKAT